MTAALQRSQDALVYFGVAIVSLMGGVLVVGSGHTVSLSMLAILAVVGFVVLASIPASALLLGWLFVAPLVQSGDSTALGRALGWALYIGPALILAVLTVLRRRRDIPLRPVDALPAAYATYVLAAILLTTSQLQDNTFTTGKAFFTIHALGAVLYYFLVFGPGRDVSRTKVVAALMVAGLVQAVFALVEFATNWNLWGNVQWQQTADGGRTVATLANPGVLGMFLGIAIVCAVSVLVWDGPRSLRRLSWAVLVLCIPALVTTMTRGPMVATAIAVAVLLLLGRARVLALGALATASIVLVMMWPTLTQTDLYRERLSNQATVEFRRQSQEWSLRLAAEKPILGWGYGSFDQVKRASGFAAEGIPIQSILQYTSHDSYLTILVELGGVGLLLYLAPFAVLAYVGAQRARAPSQDRWLIVGSLGCLVVIFLSASTLDIRFFSFAQVLPLLFLAVLRVTTSAPPSPTQSSV